LLTKPPLRKAAEEANARKSERCELFRVFADEAAAA
jgi:hypothetical protein